MKLTKEAYILTGGLSRRFGRPKCEADLKGKPMLDRVADNLRSRFTDVFQVGKQAYGSLPFVPDIAPEQTPLTGVITALNHSKFPWIFVIACDLPLIDDAVIKVLQDAWTTNTQIILPEVDGYRQYMCGFYHKNVLPLFEEKLASGERAIHRIIQDIPYSTVTIADTTAFTNVNTKADLARVKKLIME
jgi:molybdopterin-guanine dinucleotide biosynthesis protein A